MQRINLINFLTDWRILKHHLGTETDHRRVQALSVLVQSQWVAGLLFAPIHQGPTQPQVATVL